MGQTVRRGNIRALIGFELFIKTACLSFCFPLFGKMFDFCMRVVGYSYITKENLAAFLASPCFLLCVLLIVSMCAVFVLFEVNAVCLAVQQEDRESCMTFAGLFFGSVRRTIRMFHKKSKACFLAFRCFLFAVTVNLPLLLFILFGLRQTEGAVRIILRPVAIVLLCVFLFEIIWFAVTGRGSMFFGLLKRSILLYISEGIIYFSGLVLLIIIVLHVVPSTVSGSLLLRIFSRYHLILGVLFVSVNTVIYEYFCAGLFVRKYGSTDFEAETGLSKKERLKKICLWFVFVVVMVVTGTRAVSFLRNGTVLLSEAIERLCITAHRGASGAAPENTMAAIELAVEEGADYTEIDVRLTADGVPVLLHDKALFRTTRVLKNVDEVTYEELSGYDAGYGYSAEYAGERVPALRDVFERFGGKIGFNIELKNNNDKVLVQTVTELIEEYGLEESCIITSASYIQLIWVKEINRELKTGYILSMVYGDFYESEAADFFSIHSGYVSEQVVKQAHSLGKEIHVWTVNRENELKRMKAIGVDNIITDNPAYAREIVQKSDLAETLGEWIMLLTSKK
ncbi:MAG: glycerophosphodiester phosphodiesterase family protein [Lachnospiraceae bacterium]|nr:glycerophosphodiester phosphodiesterase family protein [Lachnospiraceae bacterium]